MGKTWAVFKYELIKTIGRRSFILVLILVPLVPALLLGLFNLIGGKENKSIQQVFISNAMNPKPMGIVDRSGIIKEVPDWLSGGKLLKIDDEASARQQTQEGKLLGFYLFAEDFLQTGKALTIKPEISIASEMGSSEAIFKVIDYNLIGANQELYNKYTNPVTFNFVPAKLTTDTRDTESATTFLVPYLILVFFYVLIISSATLMLNSVSQEKENRTMEILLGSAKPIEIYLGKLMALGLAAFLQMFVWLSAGIFLFRFAGQSLSLGLGAQIPLRVILVAIPAFLFGYAIYGSLMAGLGALAPNLREANQSTFVVLIPLIFCMLVLGQLMQDPNGTLITFLSLFPLTSVIMLPTRVAIVNVPLWQILLSLALIVAFAVLVVRAVANLFHAQTLLTGRKFKTMEFIKLLFVPEKA
ncbi:MAG: ABC transporter permease [Anaerolineaceae bacterium]|nr:ABC transporter permease [Anaerolineaceae bacterium]